MKILIAHNDHGRRSGEESAVDNMEEMMQAHGHHICFYRPSTAGQREGLINKVRVFFAGMYSRRGIRGIKKALHTEQPDIINIHNLYPFISPAALFTCKSARIPIVMTVHNYRLICPTGLFLRDGRPCEHCLVQGNEWGCVRYNCEKNFLKSLAYALRGYIARKTRAYQKNVDRYVCLTSFQKKKLIEAGFPEEKIRVIPNSLPVIPSWSVTSGKHLPSGSATSDKHMPSWSVQPGKHIPSPSAPLGKHIPSWSAPPGKYIAYVGRLSREKGWDMLMDIARRNPRLRIEAAGFNEAPIPGLPPNIYLHGHLTGDRLTGFYHHARFLVIPSRCYEGFPLVALEAMALGRTVIAPDHGGFSDILGKGPEAIGRLFRPNDCMDLESAILQLWQNEKLTKELGKRCFEKIKTSYTSEIVYRQWEQLFLELLQTQNN